MIVLWICALSTGLPKLTQTRWKNLRAKISPNLCCSQTKPAYLHRNVQSTVWARLNRLHLHYWYVKLLLNPLIAYRVCSAAQSEPPLAPHPPFWMSSTFEKGSPVRRPEVTKRVSYIQREYPRNRVCLYFLVFPILEKGSSNFLIWFYNIHFRKGPPSFFPKKLKTFPIKLSHTHLKSEFHPKTLNLWSTTPYKNTIKCLWMPFFIHFAINMEKKLSYCASERNKYFLMFEGRGGIFFCCCTNYRNSSNEKAFPPHLISQTRCTALTSNEMVGIEMRDGNKKKWAYRDTCYHCSPLLSDASLCPQHLLVHSF